MANIGPKLNFLKGRLESARNQSAMMHLQNK